MRLLIATLLLALAGGAHAKEWTTVRVATEANYVPFNSKDKHGQLVGFDIDIANALCAEIKVKCSFVVQDWDGMIPSLLARKFDVIISSMSITEERKAKVAFTGKYYNTPSRFIVKKGKAWDFSVQGMKDKIIGVPSTTIFDRYVADTYEKHGVKVVRYSKQDDVFLDLAAGRIQATVADPTVARLSFFNTSLGADFEVQGPELNDVKYFGEGAGIATRKQDAELRDKFDAAIKAIRANGTYERIMKKYFEYDIWGG